MPQKAASYPSPELAGRIGAVGIDNYDDPYPYDSSSDAYWDDDNNGWGD